VSSSETARLSGAEQAWRVIESAMDGSLVTFASPRWRLDL
jgi:hypothetical protein